MTTGAEMTYEKLVESLSEATNLPPEAVRALLFALPDVLITLEEDERLRTPLGVFRMIRRKVRYVTPPVGSKTRVKVPAELSVKLRAGSRLRRKP